MDDELAKQAQINTARARLARWIGNVAQADMPQTMPNLHAVLSLNQLLKGLINHPQIRKYELTIALAQTEMDLAQADKIPDWTVELGYAKRGSAYPDMIAAQVSVDLPVFPKNRQDKNITGKQMMLESARYQREDALRNLTAELTGYYSDWEISQRRINLLASSALPVAQQRIAAVLISYQNNQSSMSNVIEAHHAELNLRLQLLEQNVAHERAQLQIAYYAGELS
jgi:outer membrane protein TolC